MTHATLVSQKARHKRQTVGPVGRGGFDCIGDVAARDEIGGAIVSASITKDESAWRRPMS